jgi:hypothetical protein
LKEQRPTIHNRLCFLKPTHKRQRKKAQRLWVRSVKAKRGIRSSIKQKEINKLIKIQIYERTERFNTF